MQRHVVRVRDEEEWRFTLKYPNLSLSLKEIVTKPFSWENNDPLLGKVNQLVPG